MVSDILGVIAGIEMFALTMGFWAFTLLYYVLTAWQKTSMGRHFMSLMIACDLIMAWVWIGFVFTVIPPWVRGWVRIILYGGLAFVVWRQVAILIKMQVIARDNPEKPKESIDERLT